MRRGPACDCSLCTRCEQPGLRPWIACCDSRYRLALHPIVPRRWLPLDERGPRAWRSSLGPRVRGKHGRWEAESQVVHDAMHDIEPDAFSGGSQRAADRRGKQLAEINMAYRARLFHADAIPQGDGLLALRRLRVGQRSGCREELWLVANSAAKTDTGRAQVW